MFYLFSRFCVFNFADGTLSMQNSKKTGFILIDKLIPFKPHYPFAALGRAGFLTALLLCVCLWMIWPWFVIRPGAGDVTLAGFTKDVLFVNDELEGRVCLTAHNIVLSSLVLLNK